MRKIEHLKTIAQMAKNGLWRSPSHWPLSLSGMGGRVLGGLFLCLPFWLRAQAPPQLPPGGLMQLQVAQPTVDVSSPVTATAAFDPPVVHVGEKSFYRVSVDAAESSIQWPDKIPATSSLKSANSARGQITQFLGNKFRSLTSFIYEMRPPGAGHFVVSNFTVNIAGQPVEIPAAALDAVTDQSYPPAPRQLTLETSATNLFLGQPFRLRVLLPAGAGNEIEALRELQINGDGWMTDRTASRQSIEVINRNGQLKPAFICDMMVTPIATGPLKLSAQGFTAGREFSGPISIHGQVSLPGGPAKYVLLVSEDIKINVQPLPTANELPGYTGAMGKFISEPPKLSTNRMRVGEPIQLKVVFHGESELTRLVPPAAPRSRDWQIIANPPPASGFTLIPLTDETHETPAIPFSYFDPAKATFIDLTIPSLPVTVVGEGLPVQLPGLAAETAAAGPQKLSELETSPGKTTQSLKPLQLQGWFVGLQCVPLIGFFALWQWDRRRRFLEMHPEIVRRRRALRALRSEKRALKNAATRGDATAFVQHAAAALRIAVAPHYPAHPQALVCGDVLAQLGEPGQNQRDVEIIRSIFAAADAQFANSPSILTDWASLQSGVDGVLSNLEAKL
ncbi:MAG: hypothetical protein WCS94_12670 [Verrucomicrobiota bacterium]